MRIGSNLYYMMQLVDINYHVRQSTDVEVPSVEGAVFSAGDVSCLRTR